MAEPERSAGRALHSQRLSAVFFGIVTIFFIGFILVASLTEGDRRLPHFHHKASFTWMFDQSWRHYFSAHDLRDISTNVLLYIPLGVFLSLTLSCRRACGWFSPWILFGTLVSYAVETTQQYIGRYPDIVDLLTNSSGFLLGFWMACFAVVVLKLQPSAIIGLSERSAKNSRLNTVTAIRFLYISIYIIVALLPFDISVSLTKISDKLMADEQGRLGLILDPFYHFRRDTMNWSQMTLEWLGLIPVAFLSALVTAWQRRFNPLTPILGTLVLTAFCEGAQVFIVSRTSDIILLPIAFTAGLSGILFAWIWLRLTDSTAAPAQQRGSVFWGWLVILYGGFVCFMAWVPFDFEWDSREILEKIIFGSNIIPFLSHFRNRDLSSALDIVKEAGLFIPLGILLAGWIRSKGGMDPKMVTVLEVMFYSIGFAFFIELSQALCIGRYPDITDIILAGIGGLIGTMSVSTLRKNR